MGQLPGGTGPYTDEQVAKLDELSLRVFDVLRNFQLENPDITEDLMMRNHAYDVGVWIALKHEHWFPEDRFKTLRFYQQCIGYGLDAGVEALAKKKEKLHAPL